MTLDLTPTVKWIAVGILAIVALAVFGFVGWKVFYAENAANAAHDKAEIHATRVVGQAKSDAGANAANAVAATATHETIIHETTRDHYVEITKQPGATDPVPPAVDDAFRRAVCMRSSAAGLPECRPVPGAGAR